jgi:hypothetical protein
MKWKGRRQSENIKDLRPGKSGDPMFETARMMAKNSDDYSRRSVAKRQSEQFRNSDAFKETKSKYDNAIDKLRKSEAARKKK